MHARTSILVASLMAGLAFVAGCKSKDRNVSSDSEGVVDATQLQRGQIEQIAEDMATAIAAKDGAYWGAYTLMSRPPEPKPVMRIRDFTARRVRRGAVDVGQIQSTVLDVLINQNCVYLAAIGADLSAVLDEQDFAASGLTYEGVPEGQMDPVGLTLTGEVVGSEANDGDVEQFEYTFFLRVAQTNTGRYLIAKSGTFRKERDI